MKQTLCFVVGARPNFVKAAPVLREAKSRGLPTFLVHTGQHFDAKLSDPFFDDLEIPAPGYRLALRARTQVAQTAEIMTKLEQLLLSDPPRLVLVFGDVTSTLAAALTASKLDIPVAHIESGLRSRDRTMPEEINRILTDHISDLLFVTEQSGVDNLRAEGIDDKRIHFVGNTMIDSLLTILPKARSRTDDLLRTYSLEKDKFALVTLHRPNTVDDGDQLRALVGVLGEISKQVPVLFPVHPRTQRNLADVPHGVTITDPLGYLDFTALMDAARIVLTDSGGIQEETTVLGVPCVTIRPSTERPVTLEGGNNIVVGTTPSVVKELALKHLSNTPKNRGLPAPPLWDGEAARRLIDVIA